MNYEQEVGRGQKVVDRSEYCCACGKYHIPPTWPVAHKFVAAAEARKQQAKAEGAA